MIVLQTNYETSVASTVNSAKTFNSAKNSVEGAALQDQYLQTAVSANSFQNVLDDLLNQPGNHVPHTNHNENITSGGEKSLPVVPTYDYRADSLQKLTVDTFRGWKPQNPIERNQLWNRIARENPEALTSSVKDAGGYDSLKEAQAAEVRDKLRALGVDLTSAVIIASREVATTVRRSDGSIPGYGSSGIRSVIESIKSSAIDGHSLAREGTGYAYVNRYGGTQVVHDLARALDYSADGKVYEYRGIFGGGHAYDANFNVRQLPLPNSRYSKEKASTETITSNASYFTYQFRLMKEHELDQFTRYAKRIS